MTREFSSDKARGIMFTAQKGLCNLCGGLMTLNRKSKDFFATFEHTVPVSRGGKGVPRHSLPLAHAICNREKGNSLDRRWYERRDYGAAPTKRRVLVEEGGLIPFSSSWLKARGYMKEETE